MRERARLIDRGGRAHKTVSECDADENAREERKRDGRIERKRNQRPGNFPPRRSRRRGLLDYPRHPWRRFNRWISARLLRKRSRLLGQDSSDGSRYIHVGLRGGTG